MWNSPQQLPSIFWTCFLAFQPASKSNGKNTSTPTHPSLMPKPLYIPLKPSSVEEGLSAWAPIIVLECFIFLGEWRVVGRRGRGTRQVYQQPGACPCPTRLWIHSSSIENISHGRWGIIKQVRTSHHVAAAHNAGCWWIRLDGRIVSHRGNRESGSLHFGKREGCGQRQTKQQGESFAKRKDNCLCSVCWSFWVSLIQNAWNRN